MTPFTISQNKWFRRVVPPVLWLGVWQFAALWVGKELLLPGPLSVLRALVSLTGAPAFWQTAGVSLLRIFAGFACGALLGTLLAGLTAASPWADLLLSPAIRVVRATPVASFIILVLLWLRTGIVPGFISALMVLPVLWANVRAGLEGTDPLLTELAAAYRFSLPKRLAILYAPSARPAFFTGCRTGMGLAWKAGVAAEVLCQPAAAIGTRIYTAKYTLDSPGLFAWTGVVIALSFLLEHLLSRLFRRWEGGTAS